MGITAPGAQPEQRASGGGAAAGPGAVVRQPAEVRCAAELEALRAADRWPRPPGWQLSPRMVETFIMGGPLPGAPGTPSAPGAPGASGEAISPKFVGDRRLVQVAIATLASDRALMLAGLPGTAKSWLSEHLAAAISGTSQLIIQGTAGTTEEQIKYSWNYALLIAEGPSRRALVESPVLRGMQRGQVVRCEELTRCAAEVQDALISVLSEKQVVIAELEEVVPAQRGFAVIGTANTRDRGVNEMSAALKRRFNFVVIPVLSDPEQEAQIVARRSRELLQDLQVQAEVTPDVVRLLTAVFAELRQGQTLDGSAKVKSPSTVLSTAELISVVADGALMGAFFGSGRTELRDCFAALVGTVAKENRNDLEVLQEYLETVVKGRRERPWPEFYAAGREALR
ncbi:MAG TPA: AAA family ATPase [Chloroflexota bacterium]|nr:AAA family ATPase [Chloroflexota bacterium]